jgi:hypothetical protein
MMKAFGSGGGLRGGGTVGFKGSVEGDWHSKKVFNGSVDGRVRSTGGSAGREAMIGHDFLNAGDNEQELSKRLKSTFPVNF